jgi:hypothetical protein
MDVLSFIWSIDLNIDEIKLGGDGLIIEIEESMFAKFKHYVGKDLKRTPRTTDSEPGYTTEEEETPKTATGISTLTPPSQPKKEQLLLIRMKMKMIILR